MTVANDATTSNLHVLFTELVALFQKIALAFK